MRERRDMMVVEMKMTNKPSNWGLGRKAPWVSPSCCGEGSLAAVLRRDVTMNEWGRRRRWRMRRMEGRRERQCWCWTPNSPHCCAGRGSWLDCSGQNHWTAGYVCVGGRRNDRHKKKRKRNKNNGINY